MEWVIYFLIKALILLDLPVNSMEWNHYLKLLSGINNKKNKLYKRVITFNKFMSQKLCDSKFYVLNKLFVIVIKINHKNIC